MTSSCPPRTIITGDYLHFGFESILSETVCHYQNCDLLELIDSTTDVIHWPDLIAVFQSRRGQFPQELIDRMRIRFPLAARVVVYGPWCEGETRSGRPIEGFHRISWHRWPTMHELFCNQFKKENGLTQWHCTDLINRADELLADYNRLLPQPTGDSLRVIVSSYRREGFDLVGDACNELPYQLTWHEEARQVPNRVDLAVINASFGLRDVMEKAKELRSRYGQIPIVLIAGFARPQDADALETIKPAKLLGKPLDNLELQMAITELASGLRRAAENQVA